MGKSTVFNGSFIKLLKTNLNLKDVAYIRTDTNDPRLVATNAPKGSLLLRQNGSGNGQLFVKLDAGTTTNWSIMPIASDLQVPFYLTENSTPNHSANINQAVLTDSDTGRKRTVPPIRGQLQSLISGSVSFPTTGAGTVITTYGTVSFGMVANQYRRVGINMSQLGGTAYTFGNAASSLTLANDPPCIPGFFPVGHIVCRTDSSNNVQNIVASDIYQYFGDEEFEELIQADNILANIKDQFVDSPYSLVTPLIVGTPANNMTISNIFFSVGSGITRDLANGTLGFTADSQSLVSVNCLDPVEFLALGTDVTQVDLVAYWNKNKPVALGGSAAYTIPPSFTYAVSRDGGFNYFPVTMNRVGTTEVFSGALAFDRTSTTEPSRNTIINQSVQAGTYDVAPYPIGTPFTLSATTKLQEVQVQVRRGSAIPSGSFSIKIIKDSSGFPSTNANDVLSVSQPISIASLALTGTLQTFTLPLGAATLVAGTYHVVFVPDATYNAGYAANSSALISFAVDTSGGTPSLEERSGTGGTTWISASPFSLTWQLLGRVLDFRVRVTSAGSPIYPCGLDAVAVYYNLNDVGIVGATRKTARRAFNSVTDNLSTFTITEFNPDPDLLTCYYVEAGQSFKVPSFALSGNVVTFPTNSFNNGGVSSPITLIFDQNNGGAFDNSDSNRRLLASNHLGSTNGTDDLSVAGRGIILKRPDGTLREIALDNFDNITISTVP